jgi:hypothetical protein
MGYERHVGRTEYYRTTPANSSPKFCWLNGKAPQGQHYGGTDVHFQNVNTCPISSELGNRHLPLYTGQVAGRWSLSGRVDLNPDAADRLELTDVAYPGWRFLLITCAAPPGTRRVGLEVGPKSLCCGLFAPKL